ncbi:MAG: C1 family peptidase [Bacteroidota bacterium]
MPLFKSTELDGQTLSTKSLKKYCPEIRNQGNVNSCVGWAVGYAAYTIEVAKHYEWTDLSLITANAFSAMFIYNQIKVGKSQCGIGSQIINALELLKDNGDVYSRDFDYPKSDCERQPTPELIEKALKFKIKDFYALFMSDDDYSKKVNATKNSIQRGSPVIIGMNVEKAFLKLKTDVWKPSYKPHEKIGGHAMVVIGFDDKKGAFEIMNSWGDQWGEKGFFWISYNDFSNLCKYGFSMVLKLPSKQIIPPQQDDIQEPIYLAGKFVLRNPIFDQDSLLFFRQTDVMLDSGETAITTYRLKKKNWEIGSLFQLVARDILPNSYVYVFSLDEEKKLEVHWPRSFRLNKEKFNDYLEGAIVPTIHAEIIIPEEHLALRKNVRGKDIICVLYSTKKINEIEALIQIANGNHEPLPNILNNVLGRNLVSKNMIKASQNEIYFTTSSDKSYIVPILLVIESENDNK